MYEKLLLTREILADLAQSGTIVVQINGDNSISSLAVALLAMVAMVLSNRRKKELRLRQGRATPKGPRPFAFLF